MKTKKPETILFVANSWAWREPEPAFQAEAEAASACGFSSRVFGFEPFLDNDYDRAFRFLEDGSGEEPVQLRGWILMESEYRILDHELRKRGYRLWTPPDEYAQALYLPRYYPAIERWTAKSVWTESPDLDEAWKAARRLGSGPWLVKDWVKSAKENWPDACVIPKNASRTEFDRVCRNLHRHRGEAFDGGYVFREMLPLDLIEQSPFGYPVHDEYRLFFWNGRLLCGSPYHYRCGDRPTPDFDEFRFLGSRISSRFFSADIARTVDGEFRVIEIGDGGVSSLPPQMDRLHFYRAIRDRITPTAAAPTCGSSTRTTPTECRDGLWPG